MPPPPPLPGAEDSLGVALLVSTVLPSTTWGLSAKQMSAWSALAKVTKPNPLERLVLGKRMTTVSTSWPYFP